MESNSVTMGKEINLNDRNGVRFRFQDWRNRVRFQFQDWRNGFLHSRKCLHKMYNMNALFSVNIGIYFWNIQGFCLQWIVSRDEHFWFFVHFMCSLFLNDPFRLFDFNRSRKIWFCLFSKLKFILNLFRSFSHWLIFQKNSLFSEFVCSVKSFVQ